jgi:hypothetical protein
MPRASKATRIRVILPSSTCIQFATGTVSAGDGRGVRHDTSLRSFGSSFSVPRQDLEVQEIIFIRVRRAPS